MAANSSGKDKLDSWKEIAGYLDRHVSTVQRWEKEGGLPVRHLLHKKRGSVYAYRSEIDAWREARSIQSNNYPERNESLPIYYSRKAFVGATIGVLGLLVGLLIWNGRGPSLDENGLNFQDHYRVLVTDFENLTGEAAFDTLLQSALLQEIDPLESVAVVSHRRVEETLLLMRRPPDSAIDRSVGREISLRQGNVSAVLSGSITNLGSSYLLNTQLSDPVQNRQLAGLIRTIKEPEEVFGVLSGWLGEAMQEHLPLVRDQEKYLARVTTSSLRALRLYTQADTFIGSGSPSPAEELLKQAIEIDPMFASAEILLAYLLKIKGRRNGRNEDFMTHAERAMQLSGTVSDRERYFIQATYYNLQGEDEKAIRAHRALISVYHDQLESRGTEAGSRGDRARLSQMSAGARQDLIYQLQHAEFYPNRFFGNFMAGLLLVRAFGDFSESQLYLNRAQNLITPQVMEAAPGEVAWVKDFPAFQAVLSGDPHQAHLHAQRVVQVQSPTTNVFHLVEGKFGGGTLGSLYLNLGLLEEARQWFEGHVPESPLRHYWLAWCSYIEGDQTKAVEHLRHALAGTAKDIPTTSRHMARILMTKIGSLEEAEELASYGKPGSILDDQIEGILNLRQGNTPSGMALLEKVLPKVRDSYFLGTEILAGAYIEQGSLARAIDLLEKGSEKKAFLLDQTVTTGPIWLKTQLQLAQLYRQTGEEEKAEEIEDQLRQQLDCADVDHPILRALGSFTVSDSRFMAPGGP
jgi:Tfp pilus assembly protein PilF